MRLLLAALMLCGSASAQRIQRMVAQSFTLTDTAAVQNFTLFNTPIQGSRERIIVSFRSSRIGSDVNYTVVPVATDPKTIEVTVPTYRPFTAQDILTVIYWTYDPQ